MKLFWSRLRRAFDRYNQTFLSGFTAGLIFGLLPFFDETWMIMLPPIGVLEIIFMSAAYKMIRNEDQIAAVEKRIEDAKLRGDRIDTLEDDD